MVFLYLAICGCSNNICLRRSGNSTIVPFYLFTLILWQLSIILFYHRQNNNWYWFLHILISHRLLSQFSIIIALRQLLGLVAQTVKNLPAMQETWVQFLSWEDPLEKGMDTRSSILAWRIPWTEDPGGLQSMGLQRVGHNWATEHTTLTKNLPYAKH